MCKDALEDMTEGNLYLVNADRRSDSRVEGMKLNEVLLIK